MKYLITVFLIITTSSVSAQQQYALPAFEDSDRLKKIEAVFPVIERIYKQHADRNRFPGLAFGIVVDGKLVFSGTQGYTDVDKKITVSSRSMFRIASMSKSVTAVAILQLRDKGKLRLDDPVSKYIPGIK